MGEVSKAKKKRVGAGEKIKFPKKKTWEGGREKIKLQKRTEIRAEKGQTKKSEAGMAQG